MLCVNKRLFIRVVDFAGADIPVKLRVGEAEIILVCFAAQTVGGNFIHKRRGQTENIAYRPNLRDGEMRKRRKITRRVAVARGVADPIL